MPSCQDLVSGVLSNPGSLPNRIQFGLATQETFNPGTVTAPPNTFDGDLSAYRACLRRMYAEGIAAGIRCDASLVDCPSAFEPVMTPATDPRGTTSQAVRETRAMINTSGVSASGVMPQSFLGIDLGKVVKIAAGTILGGPAGGIAAAGLPTGGGSPGTPPISPLVPRTPIAAVPTCPDGFKIDSNGRCAVAGVGGVIQRTLPGGKSGFLEGGIPVKGAMEIPAETPTQVGVINNRPILRCRAGMILGKDDLCYVKGSLPRVLRKWKPGPRPPVTGGDAKAIRRAKAATGRVKKLAGSVGFSVSKRGSRPSSSPRRNGCK